MRSGRGAPIWACSTATVIALRRLWTSTCGSVLRVDPHFGESLSDHIQRILRQLQPRQFLAREPLDFSRVTGGGEISRNPAAEKINQNVVILHAPLWAAQDAVVDAEEFAGFDGKS